MAKKLNLVDMYGIGLMLEHLVAEGNITCEERDRVILRIARENDIAEYMDLYMKHKMMKYPMWRAS